MPIALILFLSIVLLGLAYRYYSPFVAARLGTEPDRPTPAQTRPDGIDYSPTRASVLFGHHFASIAGAAPIVGPIVGAAYGWGPVILWVLLGGIFMGAAHDFAALIVSLRHDGMSVGEVIGRQLGRGGKTIFLVFLWAALVLVIAVFLIMTVSSFEAGPSVGTSSIFLIFCAVLFGLAMRSFRFSLFRMTISAIAILLLCLALGWRFPISLGSNWWMAILIVYIFAASVMPVWLLLQPRDYLCSFLLYALLGLGVVGIFVARPAMEYPFFVAWHSPSLGPIFPILFVTVACGAISGFHSIVAAGTTVKQLASERDARPIGYGAMLVESLLAVIAIVTVMRLSRSGYADSLGADGPIALFSRGMGAMVSTLGIAPERGADFAALAVSAFVLTTLDTATRLARLTWQEMFAAMGARSLGAPGQILCNRFVGAIATLVAAGALAFSGEWKTIWPIFGAANQLLAALALLAVTLWLASLGRNARLFRIPMAIMFAITLSALGVIVFQNMRSAGYMSAAIAAGLFALGLWLLAKSKRLMSRSANKRSPQSEKFDV